MDAVMDTESMNTPVQVLIVAVPETAGSALYGMLDVLSAAVSSARARRR